MSCEWSAFVITSEALLNLGGNDLDASNFDDNEGMGNIPWFAWDILAEDTRELTGI